MRRVCWRSLSWASWMLLSTAACTRDNPAFYDSEAGVSTASGDDGVVTSAAADTRHEDADTRDDHGDDGTGNTLEDGPQPTTGIDPGTTTDGPMTSGTAEGSSGDSGGPIGVCCTATDTPGCPEDPSIEACVCAQDAYCCQKSWDGICTDAAPACGAQCPQQPGACCAPQPEGCIDPAVVQCVCQTQGMDQCCDPSTWAAECAEAAVNLCSACLGGNSCCMVSSEPGCNDPDIVACVCASDPYCCQTEWDMFCTQGGIENACDFECPIPGDTCCATSPDPGCSNAAIEGCVCETDGFCCESAWDDMCVEEAIACGGCVG